MSILLTGSEGFIARGLDIEADRIDIKKGVDVVFYKATKKYDVVIHTAAKVSVTESMKYPYKYVLNNINGTLNMLQQHPEAHFIYLSTCSIYGEGKRHTTISPLKPSSVYASTKLAGEFLVRNLAKSWAILRLTNVIGEGERGEANVFQIFEKQDVLTVFGDGLQTRDFVDVEFVRKQIIESIGKKGLFNIGRGFSETVLSVAKSFNKPIEFLPARPGEVRNFGLK